MYRALLLVLVFCLFALSTAENYFPEPPSPPKASSVPLTRSATTSRPARRVCFVSLSLSNLSVLNKSQNRFAGTIHRVENGSHIISTHSHVTVRGPLGDEVTHEITRLPYVFLICFFFPTPTSFMLSISIRTLSIDVKLQRGEQATTH